MAARAFKAPRALWFTAFATATGLLAACDAPKAALVGSDASGVTSASAAGSAAPRAPKPTAPAVVDLLQLTESDVAVSSNVDNPKDFPEHLLDGKPDTAWNGKTGDLRGWISFRVPDDAQVSRIMLTAGFDKKNAEGDLFTMNHRIKKVRVTRNGEVVGEQALDIEKRTLQSMKIGKPGGTYKVEITETESGTKKEWKELTVSEFRVLGTPGKSGVRATPRIPDVRVGALSGVHLDRDNRTLASLSLGFAKPEEFCKAFRTHYTPINATRTEYPGPVETTCAASDASTASIKGAGVTVAPFVDVLTYAAVNDQASFGAVVLRTDKAWFFVGPHLSADAHGDPHCGGYGEYLGDAKATFATSSRGPTALITWHYGYENHGPNVDDTSGAVTGTFANSHISFNAVTCVASGALTTCDKVQEVEAHFEEEPLSIARTWRSNAKVSVKPDGTLGVEPK